MPNGIEFWKIENQSLVHLFNIEPKDWGPIDLKWIDNNTLITIQDIPQEFSKTNQEEKNYLKIKLIE